MHILIFWHRNEKISILNKNFVCAENSCVFMFGVFHPHPIFSYFSVHSQISCVSHLFHKLSFNSFSSLYYSLHRYTFYIFVYYVDYFLFSMTTTTTMSITFSWLQIYLASHPFLSEEDIRTEYVAIYICTNVQTKILHWSQFNKKKREKKRKGKKEHLPWYTYLSSLFPMYWYEMNWNE